jgi:hypothetical protein
MGQVSTGGGASFTVLARRNTEFAETEPRFDGYVLLMGNVKSTQLNAEGVRQLTPKALANSSPGLLQPWDTRDKKKSTLKAFARS